MRSKDVVFGTDLDAFESTRVITNTSKASRAFDVERGDADRLLAQARNQNEILVTALHEAREQIAALKEEVDKLCAPPSTYGVYLAANEDNTVAILSQGRKVKVNLHPSIKPETLKPGQELILNEGLNVIEAADVVVADVGHFLERKILDLALGQLLQQVARLRIHQDVVADQGTVSDTSG